MDKKSKIIILILVLLIFIIMFILYKIDNFKNKKIEDEDSLAGDGEIYSDEYSELNYIEDYFLIKEIIENYLNNIKKINNNSGNIKQEGIEYIKNILDKHYIEKMDFNDQKINNFANNYLKNSELNDDIKYNFIFNNINVKKIENNIIIYLIDISINNIDSKLIIKKDDINKTYSIFLEDYKEDIDEKEIIKNNNNLFNNIYPNSEDIAKEYFRIINVNLNENKQKLFEHIYEKYKENNYSNYEEFEKYLLEKIPNTNNLELSQFKASYNEKTSKYILVDNYDNIYVVYVSGIFDYQLVIN